MISERQRDLEKEVLQLRAQLADAKRQLDNAVNQPRQKVHNERGAGRKSKVDEETAAEILRLWNCGRSLSQIVKDIAQSTGVCICKATVHNILRKY